MIVVSVLMIILGLGIFAGVISGLWNTPEVMTIDTAATGGVFAALMVGVGLALLFEHFPVT